MRKLYYPRSIWAKPTVRLSISALIHDSTLFAIKPKIVKGKKCVKRHINEATGVNDGALEMMLLKQADILMSMSF